MNFIKVNIKSKKSGFTLIELLVVTFLISLMTSIGAVCIFKYMKMYRQQMDLSREKFYIDEAFLIIENEIYYSKYVEIKNNCIMVRNPDLDRNDYIREDRDCDLIISYKYRNSFVSNNILKGVKNFKAVQCGRLLYVIVETKKGNVYKRCFGLERIKNVKVSH